MSFYDLLKGYEDLDYDSILGSVTDQDIVRILNKESIDKWDFLRLLSPKAKNHLEEIALKARKLHLKHFGKSIVLFTPMYIANYCVNRCMYCSYNIDTDIRRHKMTGEEIEREAKKIRETELKNILILTGEDKKNSSVDYILVGHIYKTKSKEGLEPRGLDFLDQIRKAVSTKVVAIGGINHKNINEVRSLKIHGIALMSYIMESSNLVDSMVLIGNCEKSS